MIETILLSLVFAKLKRYKLTPLFKTWTIYPVFIYSLIYIVLQIMIFNNDYRLIRYSNVFHLSYILIFLILIIKYKLNYSAIIGSICIFIGGAMNNIAISANGGKMPIFPSLSYFTG